MSRALFTAPIGVLVCVVLVLFSVFHSVPSAPAQDAPSAAQTNAAAQYVGRQVCAQCHAAQHALWQGSHHDLAMQEATEQTVLGNFDQAQFTYFGTTSTFYRRDGKFMVRTDGPDGTLQDYEITYTFGAHPLQQYLIAFPDGRLQALGIAWDSRPRAQGGQRWFHLYPHERITHDDPLHWTGLNQNWNSQCAECHSTNLRKHYDAVSDRYDTTWSELDVSCEACHGPGSRHVAWAAQTPTGKRQEAAADNGLVVRLHDRASVTWNMDATTGTARRSLPRTTDVEIELCARCHARRSVLSEDYTPGQSLLQTHLPSLLEAGLYHADGQIQDEVYVYGSFLQSKMYRAGVTCSDCHEPHSLRLRAPGNGVCAQCHLPARYDTSSHHFHPQESAGARCVACHMPARTYMVVDPRHDHSLRVPRPDLAAKLGTPDPCTQCHAPRTAAWAAEQLRTWYGRQPRGYQDYAEALHAGRTGAPAAERLLARLAENAAAPPIARATALAALRRYLSPASLPILQRLLRHDHPLLRVGAVEALAAVPPAQRFPLAGHLLHDPMRAVRIQAARHLAAVPAAQLTEAQRGALARALEEYIAAQQVNAERPEAHLNLGNLYAEQGQFAAAEAAYRTALRRQPTFVQAYVNLADLARQQGRDDEGEGLLRQALTLAPQNAEVHHALGLLLVRQRRHAEAVAALAQAARLRPDDPRYSYVYAVALHDTGRPREAIRVLEQTHARHPYDREVLVALVTYAQEAGDMETARRYADKLRALTP
jgi:tetratricopeptide (TPR) repeat protein